MSDCIVRDAKPEDLDSLHHLIVKSTGGRTKITISSLYDDLFKLAGDDAAEVEEIDPCIELDPNILKSNKPMMHAFVAEHSDTIVGYLMFHYYWAPWVGKMALIDDIYIKPGLNETEIGSELLLLLQEHGYRDDLRKMVFSVAEKKSSLLKIISELELSVVRDDTIDWSIYRVPMQMA